MVEWRLWRKRDSPVDATPAAQAVQDAAADGLAMTKQAALMAIKNRILVETITKPEGFDPQQFLDVAREIVDGLIEQSLASAALLKDEIRRAKRLSGEAMTKDDYRRGDVLNLTIRKESLELVAAQLRERETDDETMLALVTEAHGMAWAEISREMERSLDRVEAIEFGDENYEQERERRLKAFITLDLAQLVEDNSPWY